MSAAVTSVFSADSSVMLPVAALVALTGILTVVADANRLVTGGIIPEALGTRTITSDDDDAEEEDDDLKEVGFFINGL